MTPVPGDEICFDKTKHHCLLWEHSWTSETHAENTRRCADDGQLVHCAMTVFFFFSFSKICWDLAELYTGGGRHGFTHGRSLPEQAACCQPLDSLFTAGNNHCVEEHEWWGLGAEEGYLKWWIPEEEPFWIKTILKKYTLTGVKCPVGEPLQLTCQHSKLHKHLKMMYRCTETILWITDIIFSGWSPIERPLRQSSEKLTDQRGQKKKKSFGIHMDAILGSTILYDCFRCCMEG